MDKWYIIINPKSGKRNILLKISDVKYLFDKYEINYQIKLTKHKHHEYKIVQNAIKQGYINFVSMGGDGTLHHIVNGIMQQNRVSSTKIKIAVIPTGTGNDWVKTYKIPPEIEKAIQLIKKDKTKYQDIGKIKLLKNGNCFYFNNVAGVGFDGHVVSIVSKFKKYGSIAYLIAAIQTFLSYKNSFLKVKLNNNIINSKIFMINIGICKFSGGGMRLTNFKNHKEGNFDITLIKNITLIKILLNINKLYNGKLFKLNEVKTYTNTEIYIKSEENKQPFIQADGELIGQGDVKFILIKNAIKFIVK